MAYLKLELIPIIFLGWPSAIIGLALLLFNLISNNRKAGIIGAAVATGFCLLAGLYPPPTRWMGLSALSCNWLSAYWSKEKYKHWRFLLLLPMTVLVIWLAYAVLSE